MITFPERAHPVALRYDGWSDDPYSDLPCDSRKASSGDESVPRKPTVNLSERAFGVLCAEAQADGVPCFELGRDCRECERALE